jgi:hypothetical protein
MRIGSWLLRELLTGLLARVLAIAGSLRARNLGGRRRRSSGTVVWSLLRDDRARLEGLVVEGLRVGLRAESAVRETWLEVGAGGAEVEVLLGVGEVGGMVLVELGGVNLSRGALGKHVGLARRLPLIHDRSCACTR